MLPLVNMGANQRKPIANVCNAANSKNPAQSRRPIHSSTEMQRSLCSLLSRDVVGGKTNKTKDDWVRLKTQAQ